MQDYLEFLAKVLSEEVASRDAHGGKHLEPNPDT